MDWFRQNSEALVMLKHLDKVSANSTAWQEVKNSSQVQEDLRELQSLFQSPEIDANATTPSPCAIDCVAASDNLIDAARSSTDSVDPLHANLTDRIEQLETKYLLLNASHPTQLPIREITENWRRRSTTTGVLIIFINVQLISLIN